MAEQVENFKYSNYILVESITQFHVDHIIIKWRYETDDCVSRILLKVTESIRT